MCAEGEENRNILMQESYNRGTNPRQTENNTSLETWIKTTLWKLKHNALFFLY